MSYESNDERMDRLELVVKEAISLQRAFAGLLVKEHSLMNEHLELFVYLINGQNAIFKCLALMPGVPEDKKQQFLKTMAQQESKCEVLEKMLRDLKAKSIPTAPPPPPWNQSGS